MGWRSHSSGDAADEKFTMTSTYYCRTRRRCCCRRYQPAAAARGGSAARGDERFPRLLFFPSVDSTTKTLAAVGAVARAHPH